MKMAFTFETCRKKLYDMHQLEDELKCKYPEDHPE
jgi:hypothetical protein